MPGSLRKSRPVQFVGTVLRRPVLAFFILFAAHPGAFGQGTFRVQFEHPTYSVEPGGVVPVNVLIDPVPGAGLFSYGIVVGFDPAKALLEMAGISVPKDLDFNGVLGPGALTSAGDGFAGVKGTVIFSSSPLQTYSGSLLATFLVTDKSGGVGSSYSLDLSLFKTLGETETVFVDGAGNPLDDKLVFGTTLINIVPEPAVSVLILPALIVFLFAVRLASFRRGRTVA